MWGANEHLLAGIFDILAGANWQRGGSKGPRPKPVKRPAPSKKVVSSTSMPIGEARARLYELTGIKRAS